jgi:hypothetical protein
MQRAWSAAMALSAPLPIDHRHCANDHVPTGGRMSRKSRALAAFLFGATLSVGVSGPPNAAATTMGAAQSWWRCPAGFAFETSGTAVHCRKPYSIQTKPFIGCLAPTPALMVDAQLVTDMCFDGRLMMMEPQCNPLDVANGYFKKHVSGKDYCGKEFPEEVIAPNQHLTM